MAAACAHVGYYLADKVTTSSCNVVATRTVQQLDVPRKESHPCGGTTHNNSLEASG
jgi:hypothetical protein